MARLPRIDIPGLPQHVVQRGADRAVCFRTDDDREVYLDLLARASAEYGCALHAYALMTNHVHLLVTPEERGGMSNMMWSLGSRYVRYFNDQHERTGTLWEGRFRSSVVDTGRYVMACYRYIELNPVRARIVDTPESYVWSSARCNALGDPDPLVTPHGTYLGMATDPCPRRDAYRQFLNQPIAADEVASIRDHLNQCKAWGSAHFSQRIEAIVGRPVGLRPAGRPRIPTK